jgi:protein MpaA
MNRWEIGRSVEGRPLEVFVFSPKGTHPPARPTSGAWLLYLGGVHGDEVEGVWLLDATKSKWEKEFPGKEIGALVFSHANPDGISERRRWNARGVDLNRNLPSKDWTPEVKNPRYPPGPSAASEPESEALVRLIAQCKPRAILSAHSFGKYQVNVNGPAQDWGEELSRLSGYPVTEDIGYPTPGSLGTFAGKELGIPTITLEIERGLSEPDVLKIHLPLVEASLVYWEKAK